MKTPKPKYFLLCLYKFVDFSKEVDNTCIHTKPDFMKWVKDTHPDNVVSKAYTNDPELFFGFDHYKVKKGVKAVLTWLWYFWRT